MINFVLNDNTGKSAGLAFFFSPVNLIAPTYLACLERLR